MDDRFPALLAASIALCAFAPAAAHAADAPPTANFTMVVDGLTVKFTDTSTDTDGTIASRRWRFGDGKSSTATNPSHTYATAGTWSVTETVTDNLGTTASTTKSVSVQASANKPPVASFSYVLNGATATFTDASTDPDGTIVKHQWNFGDNSPPSTETNPVHTFPGGGDAGYTVTETVTDNGGASAATSRGVMVGSGGPQFLLANTGFETTGSWTASSGVLCKVGAAGCSGEPAHAGTGFAWLGGTGTAHTDTLSQTSNAPLLSGRLNLQFWLHVDTAETSTTTAYDKLGVGLYDTAGNLLRTVATFSNLDKAAGYQSHSYDMTPWVGQKVVLKFTATEDSSQQTSFVLDDVTLNDYAQ